MTYNEVTVQSRLQFQNENDTNILFALNERLVLDRDLRQITIGGSGATGATDTTGALQTTLATDIIGTSISSAELTLTSRISIWSDLPPLGTDTRTDWQSIAAPAPARARPKSRPILHLQQQSIQASARPKPRPTLQLQQQSIQAPARPILHLRQLPAPARAQPKLQVKL
ncbi:unnamed protein product [Rotaria socialis]|uniref:Uncharacterized protein n=1 Tax=Rotaria socialis TaxID=392032 RepID=A0A821UQG9_9BILA|nr:unnamed protein product [Rotaria socialis]